MAVYLVMAAVLAWQGTSAGIYFFVKYRAGYTDVSYTQIAGLPFTLEAYRKDRGKYWIQAAKQAAEAGQWFDAFGFLRAGLPDVPEDQEARMLLARIFVMAGRPDQVRQVLLKGLPYNANETKYVSTVLGFLFDQQADASVIEIANELSKRKNLPTETKDLIRIARLYAYFNRDELAQATLAIKDPDLAKRPEATWIQARIEWELGHQQTALVLLQDLHEKQPKDLEIYRTLIFFLRESKRFDEARRVILSRQINQPLNPEAYLNEIALYEATNEQALQLEREVEFIKRFPSDSVALLKLAQIVAKRGDAKQAWTIAGLIPKSSEDSANATFIALGAELTRGAYKEAEAQASAALANNKSWSPSQRMAAEGIRAIAMLGQAMNSDAQEPLKQILASPAMPPGILVTLADQAQKLSETEVASQLLHRAAQLDPLSQPALVALLRLELGRKNLDEALPFAERLPTMRKPPTDLMADLAVGLESDRYLFLKSRRSVISTLNNKISVSGKLATGAVES